MDEVNPGDMEIYGMKKAMVTGVTGQDGFYMAKLLSGEGYEVLGLGHRSDRPEDIDSTIHYRYLDIVQDNLLYDIVDQFKPDEIYNFAAQSSSINSWQDTRDTIRRNTMAVAAILESIRDNTPHTKMFQASSAEVFGQTPADVPQKESTLRQPFTPYATAKIATDSLINEYRLHYGIFAVSGILYNHESPRRKSEFLSTKIARTVAEINRHQTECLYVGNLDSRRDWGYAPDYMYAAWRTLQLDKADDYIFATGIQHTVREYIEVAFQSADIQIRWKGVGIDEVGIDDATGRIVVAVDKQYYRDYDRCDSIGNPEKLYNAINWRPQTSFEDMVMLITKAFI